MHEYKNTKVEIEKLKLSTDSNKIRNFIRILCEKMNINVQFVFLDDNFYKFSNSHSAVSISI